MSRKAQDKEQELLLFNTERADAYDLHDESFFRTLEAWMERTMQPLLTGTHHVLEAGCGTGAFCRNFIRYLDGRAVWETTGVDIAPAMIAWNERHPLAHYRSIVGDLEDAGLFAPESFDLALCPMTLHHFPDPRATLRNIATWLKPGGYLFIIEPNGSSPVNRLSKFIRRCLELVMGLDYTRRFATVNETDHSMRSYLRWLAQNDLAVCHRETWSILPSTCPVGMMNGSRYYLYKMTNLLWQPLSGNTLVLLAQKHKESV
ncbi:MAG: class I SAM-dependent methyltransferase [Kiritimatiellaeota bacterium]|nr:class I SAM-dependent methyltransferase [Kiritimatiellota bacterium]